MLITPNKYYEELIKLPDECLGRKEYIIEYLKDKKISEQALKMINKYSSIPSAEFYIFLSKKLHKVVKEALNDEPRPMSECIKTVTSIITQATITLEKQFSDKPIKESNEFIRSVGLDTLSKSLSAFFENGNSEPIQNEIKRVREDIMLANRIAL